MKNYTLATVNNINEKCVPGALAFQELVNHSCLCESECLHPFEQNSDQKLQNIYNKVYCLFFQGKLLKTGVVTL